MDVISIAGLGATLLQWLSSLKDRKAKATIDDYLEWLRRQNHEKLLKQVDENRVEVEQRIDSVLDSVGWAIVTFDENQQRRHTELIDLLSEALLDLDQPKLKITQLVGPLCEGSARTHVTFRFDFQAVNNSKSRANIASGVAFLRDGTDTLRAQVNTMSLPGGELALEPNLGSGRFSVKTNSLPLEGRSGRQPELVELELNVRQFDEPLRFQPPEGEGASLIQVG